MAYVLNNIRFRSVSSKSLERYYNVKSFVLSEMSDGRRQFSETARETMLLIFNCYSTWIIEVESMMLNRCEITDIMLETIFDKQDGLINTYSSIMASTPGAFSPEFVKVWRKVHPSVTRHFRQQAGEILGLNSMLAFPLLIDTLIDSLRTTLYELYELDCLLGSELVTEHVTANRCHISNMLTYLTAGDIRYLMREGRLPLLERLQVYEEHIFKPEIEVPLIVKNFTEAHLALKQGKVVGENEVARALNSLVETNPRFKIVEIIH